MFHVSRYVHMNIGREKERHRERERDMNRCVYINNYMYV